MIGAVLAGGDWDHIKYLMQKELKDCQVSTRKKTINCR